MKIKTKSNKMNDKLIKIQIPDLWSHLTDQLHPCLRASNKKQAFTAIFQQNIWLEDGLKRI